MRVANVPAEEFERQIETLRERYPELADKVIEGELTLEGARAEAAAARGSEIPFERCGSLKQGFVRHNLSL